MPKHYPDINVHNHINLADVMVEYAGTFQGANNQTSPVNVPGIIFPSGDYRSFNLILNVNVVGVSNHSAQFTIEGIQGSNGWGIFDSFVGDETGLLFSVTSEGQIQYTSTNISGWTSTIINYQVMAYRISGSFSNVNLVTSANTVIPGTLTILNTSDANGISSASLAVDGGLSVAKNITLGGGMTIGSHIIPSTNIAYDLGSSSNRWRDLYLSGNTINLGGVPISTNTTGTIAFGSTVLATTTVGNVNTSINVSTICTGNLSVQLSTGNFLVTDYSSKKFTNSGTIGSMVNTDGIYGTISSDYSGQNVVYTRYDGDNTIYISNDYANSFTPKVLTNDTGFSGVASSSDFKYISVVGISQNGQIHTNSTYGNGDFVQATGYTVSNAYLSAISMSGSGQYQLASWYEDNYPAPGITSGNYLSTDYGSTFNPVSMGSFGYTYTNTNGNYFGFNNNFSVMSYTGQYQLACCYGAISDYAYISNDYGTNWTTANIGPLCSFTPCDMSSDGRYQVISNYDNTNGNIYISSSYGANWTTVFTLTNMYLGYLNVSETGQYIIAGDFNAPRYIYSNDYGNTWNIVLKDSNLYWGYMPKSAIYLLEGAATGFVYKYNQDYNVTKINSSISTGNVVSNFINTTKLLTKNIGIDNVSPIAPLSIGNAGISNSDGYITIGKNNGGGGTRQVRIGYDSDFNLAIGDYGSNNNPGTWIKAFKLYYSAPEDSIVINNNGNVGIGTDSSRAKLEVNGNIITPWQNSFIGTQFSDGNDFRLGFRTESENRKVIIESAVNDNSGSVVINTNNITRLTVNNNGNVGIGTISPNHKLDINGGLNIASGNFSYLAGLRIAGSDANTIYQDTGILGITTNNNDIILSTANGNPKVYIRSEATLGNIQLSNNVQNRNIVLYDNNNNNNEHQFYGLGINSNTLRYQVDGVSSAHRFYAATSATSSNELMTINGDGYVGIGTTSPSSALEVNGDIKATNMSISNNLSVMGTLTVVNITNTNLLTTTSAASIGTLVSETLISASNLNAINTTLANLMTTGLFNFKTSTNSSSGSFNRLLRPSPVLIMNSGSAINIYGIEAGNTGDIFIIMRAAFGSSITLYHNGNGGSPNSNEVIILPNGLGSKSVTDRAGFILMYLGTAWYLIAYT